MGLRHFGSTQKCGNRRKRRYLEPEHQMNRALPQEAADGGYVFAAVLGIVMIAIAGPLVGIATGAIAGGIVYIIYFVDRKHRANTIGDETSDDAE